MSSSPLFFGSNVYRLVVACGAELRVRRMQGMYKKKAGRASRKAIFDGI
jgi:hypothetical protein